MPTCWVSAARRGFAELGDRPNRNAEPRFQNETKMQRASLSNAVLAVSPLPTSAFRALALCRAGLMRLEAPTPTAAPFYQ